MSGEWQPIETAPKDGRSVLIWLADEGFCEMARWRRVEGEEWSAWYIPGMDLWTAEDGAHEITHWQPLPKPPSPSPS